VATRPAASPQVDAAGAAAEFAQLRAVIASL
jgi:hypothetical protein